MNSSCKGHGLNRMARARVWKSCRPQEELWQTPSLQRARGTEEKRKRGDAVGVNAREGGDRRPPGETSKHSLVSQTEER